jgi:potassium efflux system protein
VTGDGSGADSEKKSMLRRLLLPLMLLLSAAAWSQDSGVVVTTARLDAAVAAATANFAADDPARASLLKLYDGTRAALLATAQYNSERDKFAQARAGAAREAAAIEAGLSERQVAGGESGGPPGKVSLADLEQQMQVSQAELDARKGKLADIQGQINSMPARAARVRSRLTELGTAIPDLQSRLALLPKTAVAGSEGEANQWLAQAQVDSALAEKAALDAELLSQPMRQQLLAARQDRTRHDIGELERSLQSMERQANTLRQGQATQAHAEAEQELAATRGKHKLVQELADENAVLSASFIERGDAIEQARTRELRVGDYAERLENDLKSIEHKLGVLGMSTAVGQILREQQAQLPKERESKKEIELVSRQLTASSVRQIELEDDRRRLSEVAGFVDKLVGGLDDDTAQLIRPDLLELARKRRDLVRQALDLETLYGGALGNLEFNLQRYAVAIGNYRYFIEERLLWIPSRDPFSLFRSDGLPAQLRDLLVAEDWRHDIRQLPVELAKSPLLGLVLILALALVYSGPRIRARIVASGREVGFVRTDAFSNTLLALGLSLVLSIRWPLLMWITARLFELQESESDLGLALHTALKNGALYFWGLEFLRALLMPRGLVASHFRWPVTRTEAIHARIVRLEQTFLPATMLVFFALSLYPREVGGPLGALGVIVLLLSLAYFFRSMPEYMQAKVSILLNDKVSRERPRLGQLVRHLLVWIPVLTTIAVLFGYIYTAVVFSLLLVKTIALWAVVFVLNDLAMRWLSMTRRRMVARARTEVEAAADEGDASAKEEALENDPELLNDEGTKLINLLTLLGLLGGVLAIWAEVLPALGVLDSVELWHQAGVVDGVEAQVPVTLGDLVTALLIAVLGWTALRRIPGLLEIFLRQRVGVKAASAYAATRVFQYTATAILVVGVLSSLGGSWSQIQWAVAALSVGIGFGLQEIVANFISGLIILFEQPIRVGDTVTVGTTSGKVTKIRIRATTIRDFDRRELLVPNKEFITQQLLNWSLSDQVTRWVVEVGVAYGSDIEQAMVEIHEAVRAHPLILKEPEPTVTFELFGDNSLLIRARFFLDQLDQRLQVASSVMLDINRRLNEKGIVVAFPQRDVHLDTSQPLEIRMMARDHPEPGPPDEANK